ncbi:transposase [Fluviibacter phosphoraccumulans]|uniref:transposase n=1 Tax=Fluviibacter phosphoraccumulans TaxID=1751046 RepID=UPI003D6B6C35
MNPNKTRYRITNWSECNLSLQSRGSLTVWMSPDILWLDSVRSDAKGRPQVYTDAAIQASLTTAARSWQVRSVRSPLPS